MKMEFRNSQSFTVEVRYDPDLAFAGNAFFRLIRVNTGHTFWRMGQNIDREGLLAHEYFHVIQYELVGGNVSSGSADEIPHIGPPWLTEGVAVFMGVLFTASSSGSGLEWAKDHFLKEVEGLTVSLAELETWNGMWSAGGEKGYWLGFLACYLLVENSGGPPTLITFWELMGSNLTWEEAFNAVWGRSVEQFYLEFAEWLKAQGQ
jgi:hypothetical protein